MITANNAREKVKYYIDNLDVNNDGECSTFTYMETHIQNEKLEDKLFSMLEEYLTKLGYITKRRKSFGTGSIVMDIYWEPNVETSVEPNVEISVEPNKDIPKPIAKNKFCNIFHYIFRSYRK